MQKCCRPNTVIDEAQRGPDQVGGGSIGAETSGRLADEDYCESVNRLRRAEGDTESKDRTIDMLQWLERSIAKERTGDDEEKRTRRRLRRSDRER
jgi:hypothetical protein